ncbi:hypothetical protein APHAL10511_002100 [Amanita phalloides]|nr:hypothetical protein APHAL10511_002100 [Amanita phalloides]
MQKVAYRQGRSNDLLAHILWSVTCIVNNSHSSEHRIVECATELFNASRLCPACETSLLEPDDVVVSLTTDHLRSFQNLELTRIYPYHAYALTFDVTESVLSGLGPMIILEICSRAISFWQYQIQQESVFQQAVLRNVSDKNAQLQKQVDNVIREANSEIGLLNGKIAELERDLEIERRKNRELQDAARERDKEYQKLKAAHDKLKRKALFVTGTSAAENSNCVNAPTNGHSIVDHSAIISKYGRPKTLDVGAVVGGMEANGIQRTPLVNRTMVPGPNTSTNSWVQQPQRNSFRPGFPAPAERSHRSGHISDCSDSANEVENLLTQHPQPRHANAPVNFNNNWQVAGQRTRAPRPRNVFAPPINNNRVQGGFRPAVGPR